MLRVLLPPPQRLQLRIPILLLLVVLGQLLLGCCLHLAVPLHHLLEGGLGLRLLWGTRPRDKAVRSAPAISPLLHHCTSCGRLAGCRGCCMLLGPILRLQRLPWWRQRGQRG